MCFQKVTCGEKITCDNLYVKSLTRTQPQTPSQRQLDYGKSPCHAVDVSSRSFCHQHRLSDYIGPSIPSGLISHKDGRMPRESRWARNFNAATAASFNPQRVRLTEDWYYSVRIFEVLKPEPIKSGTMSSKQ
jgi:hypothetical protein